MGYTILPRKGWADVKVVKYLILRTEICQICKCLKRHSEVCKSKECRATRKLAR